MEKVFLEIRDAKVQAEEKHGVNRHDYPIWISLMAEELGEAAKEAHTLHWRGYASQDEYVLARSGLRQELIDLAQLVVAAIEQLDSEGFR